MSRPPLWLFLAPLARTDAALAIPAAWWIAQRAGALLDTYLECRRDGRLFARCGSTVLAGRHHQSFHRLCARFAVSCIRFGGDQVFASAIAGNALPELARTGDLARLYRDLLAAANTRPRAVVLMPEAPVAAAGGAVDIAPYLFNEVARRQALAFPPAQAAQAAALAREHGLDRLLCLHCTPAEEAAAAAHGLALEVIDRVAAGDGWAELTGRAAARWEADARGVAFGDPDAIRAQLAEHCTQGRVALYAPVERRAGAQIADSAYAEQRSPLADRAAELARRRGDGVIAGRQTGDGDIRRWSAHGACIQIIDPDRPVFATATSAAASPWQAQDGPWGHEPDDAQLAAWADEGRVLATLLWHSGEVAHDQAMLNLVELATRTGLRMGIGVHAQRYRTCPELWEQIAVAAEHGGAAGLIEPVLHSGGLGVCAEHAMEPARLGELLGEALARIRAIAGDAGTPRGWYPFLDTDLGTLMERRPELWRAAIAAGCRYVVSSARPGRNRVLLAESGALVLNQTPRVIHPASPFVRITGPDDLETAPGSGAGWVVGVLDAPVIAFEDYIWRHGQRFMALADRLRAHWTNVTPHVVARYAALLHARGMVPVEDRS